MAIAIPPYSINSPLPTGATPNLLFGDVWQGTLNIPVAAIGFTQATDSLISFFQAGTSTSATPVYTFGTRVTDPTLRFQKFAYTAGQVGIYTLNFTACTPVIGKTYLITIFGGSQTYPYQIGALPVVATTTSATDLATAVYNTLNNAGQSAFFTVSNNGAGTITLTEVNTQTGGFTVLFQGDTNYVFGTTQADIAPVGTLAQIQSYFPGRNITSGTFNLYQWSYDVHIPNTDGSGQDKLWKMFIQIFIDLAAVNYAAADTLMVNIGQLNTSYFGSSYSSLLMQQTFGVPN